MTIDEKSVGGGGDVTLMQDLSTRAQGFCRVTVYDTDISAEGVTPFEARTIAAQLVALMLGVSPVGLRFRLSGWPEQFSDISGFWTCATPTWGWDLRHPVERAAWLSRYRYEQSGPLHRDGPLLLIYSNDGWEHISAPGFPFTSVTDPNTAFDRAQSYADGISRLAVDPTAKVASSAVLPTMVLTQGELAAHLGDRESVRNAVASGLYGSSAQAAGLLLQMEVRAWSKTMA